MLAELPLEAEDLSVCGGQPLFELLDAFAVVGAFAAERPGEGMDHRAVVWLLGNRLRLDHGHSCSHGSCTKPVDRDRLVRSTPCY